MNDSSLTSRAVQLLRSGGVVAVPTETVYGLGANAEDELAVRRVFAIKGRPSTHPLIVHVADGALLTEWAREIPDEARALAAAFWPGPLTLVFKRTARATDAITGGQDTVAVRVPRHPVIQAVLAQLGGGIAAPSANRFGRVSPTEAAHVIADLGSDVDLVLDGGPCAVGLESTIVDVSEGAPRVLRPGGLAVEDLERVLGRAVPVQTSDTVRVSGSLESHYAPRAGVLVVDAADVERVLEEQRARGLKASRLPLPEDTTEAAKVLYRQLREADTRGDDVIVIASPRTEGLGLALRDRLKRAAAPR